MFDALEARVKRVARQAEAIWPELKEKNFANNIKVGIFRNSKNVGLAFIKARQVYFNMDLLEHYGLEMCHDYVIHEVAHIAVGKLFPVAKQWHGKEFRSVCRALGGSGCTGHSLDTSVSVAVPHGAIRGRIHLNCVCGTKMYIKKSVYARIKEAPERFVSNCCGTPLNQVMEAA